MELAIDAADDVPGVALAVDGVAGLVATWDTERNHSVELLPNIDRLLAEASRTRSDVGAVFVDIGPGGYAALRVGVSIAKGIAHGLAVPIVGIGRLELDAYGVTREAIARRIVALHRAGRGEVAWAAYRLAAGEAWQEERSPGIVRAEQMCDVLEHGDLLTGEVDDQLAEAAQHAGATVVLGARHRVVALAALGHARLVSGRIDDAAALVPMYLRAPAIGWQR